MPRKRGKGLPKSLTGKAIPPSKSHLRLIQPYDGQGGRKPPSARTDPQPMSSRISTGRPASPGWRIGAFWKHQRSMQTLACSRGSDALAQTSAGATLCHPGRHNHSCPVGLFARVPPRKLPINLIHTFLATYLPMCSVEEQEDGFDQK